MSNPVESLIIQDPEVKRATDNLLEAASGEAPGEHPGGVPAAVTRLTFAVVKATLVNAQALMDD